MQDEDSENEALPNDAMAIREQQDCEQPRDWCPWGGTGKPVPGLALELKGCVRRLHALQLVDLALKAS